MSICVRGNFSLSRATHSMPLMPGRLMSISTTSGASPGKVRNASSPLAQARRHFSPRARPNTASKCSRVAATSSTMAMVMVIDAGRRVFQGIRAIAR